ncbi:MAG: flippase-like domain-containing protein [Deltaproteobacteria bacterium]|nr:flippase-like domain-containing protein [Deltaproteobacteria bacterium]
MTIPIINIPPSTEDEASAKSRKSKAYKTIIRLAISILILSLILYKLVDRRQLLEELGRLSPNGVIILIIVYALGQVLSAIKWMIFAEYAQVPRSLWTIIRAYFLGMFVNTFGLGTVGGDVARGLLLNPEKGKRAAALASVVADRIHGLAVLLTIGSITSVFIRPKVALAWIYPLGVMAIPVMYIAWVHGPLLLAKLVPDKHRWKQAAINATRAFITKPFPFLFASALSVIFHFSQIYLHVLILAELNAHIPFWYLVATVPFINILCSLPLSMNGMGLREGLYIFFFAAFGLSQETLVAMGLIWIFTITVISAASGLFFGVIHNLLNRSNT